MATSRPRVLQFGKMPLPQLDAELAQAYEVTLLSEQPDRERFLAEHGAQFEYLVTSAAMGLPAFAEGDDGSVVESGFFLFADLQAFDGRVHITDSAADSPFFTHDMPGL